MHQLERALFLSLMGLCGVASAADPPTHPSKLNIRSQPIGDALNEFARQSGLQVVIDPREGGKIISPAVIGTYTPDAALTKLLLNTGLRYEYLNERTVAVRPAAASAGKEIARPLELPRTPNEGPRIAPTNESVAIGESALGQSVAGSRYTALEEIVVTANKRAERLHDVAASVSAVTGDALASIGAARMEDYVAKVPGLVLSNVSFLNGSNQLAIRGITTGSGGNPTVGIYIDDSPFGASNGFGANQIPDLDPSDLSRVEVLRGPQGTLYGAGSMGGLLKYVTATPDPSRFFGRVQVGGSQVDAGGSGYSVRAAANIPLSDALALRVSGYDRTDPGFVENVATGARDLNDTHFYGGRASLAWQVNEAWKVRLSSLVQRNSSDASAVVDHDSLTFAPLYGDLGQSRPPGTGETQTQLGAHSVQIDGDLGWAALSSSSSYNRQVIDVNLDVTSGYGPVLADAFGVPGAGAVILTDGSLDKYTQEIRLASPESQRISWLVGVFYTHEEQWLHQAVEPLDAASGGPLPFPLPVLLDAYVDSKFEEAAAFGTVTYHFTPSFDLAAGVRYSENKQRQLQTLSGVVSGDAINRGSSRDDSTTYMLTPRWRLNDDVMVYARVASGYRPGGPNLVVAGVPLSYGPDTLVNYEVGLKADLLDQLTVDVAAYYIDWRDIQLNQSTPEGLDYFGNAGSATSRGLEISTSWMAATGLQIDANVSYTLAELGSDLPPGHVIGFDGDELPTTPKWSGQLSADYKFPLTAAWSGMVGAGYRYVGESAGYFPPAAVPRYVQPDYDVVDFRAAVMNDRVTLSLFARNLGDSRGQQASFLLGNATRVSIIQPRTYGVSFSTSF